MPAYNGYAQYDPAAYAAYYQQYNAYYGAYGTAPPQPMYPGYQAASQQQAYPGYGQPAGYAAVPPPGYAPAAPAAAPMPPAAPRPQQPQQLAVSSNAAPWQKAAAKVATAMQAQKQGAVGQQSAKPVVAKSFSIQSQPSKLRLGGGAAFAAASSPAYVKVCAAAQSVMPATCQRILPGIIYLAHINCEHKPADRRSCPRIKVIGAWFQAGGRGAGGGASAQGLPVPAGHARVCGARLPRSQDPRAEEADDAGAQGRH
jgi:hypothetical protein